VPILPSELAERRNYHQDGWRLSKLRPEWRARPFQFGGANIHGGDSEAGPPRGALRPGAAGSFRVHHHQQWLGVHL